MDGINHIKMVQWKMILAWDAQLWATSCGPTCGVVRTIMSTVLIVNCLKLKYAHPHDNVSIAFHRVTPIICPVIKHCWFPLKDQSLRKLTFFCKVKINYIIRHVIKICYIRSCLLTGDWQDGEQLRQQKLTRSRGRERCSWKLPLRIANCDTRIVKE